MYITGLFILYAVIKGAIDGSETAENIRQIRIMLRNQYPEYDDNDNTPEVECDIENIPITECPACGEKVSPSDKRCPFCGLALILDEDDINS